MRRLEELQKLAESLPLKSISLRVGSRYNYYAIDIYLDTPQGARCLDTLVTGLGAGECERILCAISRVLTLEERYGQEGSE